MHDVIHISPATCSGRDIRLNAAIDAAMSLAARDRAGGILVTKLVPAHFTVTITPDVFTGW